MRVLKLYSIFFWKGYKMSKSNSRPTQYSNEIGDYVCHLISTNTCGERVLVNKYPDFPKRDTLRSWIIKYPEFAQKVARAKMWQIGFMAQECIDIAEDSAQDTIIDENGKRSINKEWIARARLRIDTIKWLASKLVPKVYGDVSKVEASVGNESMALLASAVKFILDDHKKDV